MSERPRRRRPPAKPARPAGQGEGAEQAKQAKQAEETVLGIIPEGPRDTRLDAATVPGLQPPSPPARGEGLSLPADAWLAARKSGGLLFRSREVVVYRDGRVTSTTVGGWPPVETRTRKLAAPQLAALRGALERVDFDRLPAAPGRQSPDAHAYEIVARGGGATRAVEVFEGSIPRALAPLIEQLNRLFTATD